MMSAFQKFLRIIQTVTVFFIRPAFCKFCLLQPILLEAKINGLNVTKARSSRINQNVVQPFSMQGSGLSQTPLSHDMVPSGEVGLW